MARLLILVEGETEETFVNEILTSFLSNHGVFASARLVGNARQRDRRGGIRGWNTVKLDIINHLKSDTSCFVTTMVDYYGLPKSGSKEWPGRAVACSKKFEEKAITVQNAIHQEIVNAMGFSFNPSRFIPFVVMHEFEGLLFSDCVRFAEGIGCPELAPSFQSIRDDFGTPEEINDSPVTAPSKRVIELFPSYEKPLFGSLAVINIGLEKIREECCNFRNWLTCIEKLSA